MFLIFTQKEFGIEIFPSLYVTRPLLASVSKVNCFRRINILFILISGFEINLYWNDIIKYSSEYQIEFITINIIVN